MRRRRNIFHLFLYCLFSVPSDQFSLRNCTFSVSLNNTDSQKVPCTNTGLPNDLVTNTTLLKGTEYFPQYHLRGKVGDFSNSLHVKQQAEECDRRLAAGICQLLSAMARRKSNLRH